MSTLNIGYQYCDRGQGYSQEDDEMCIELIFLLNLWGVLGRGTIMCVVLFFVVMHDVYLVYTS